MPRVKSEAKAKKRSAFSCEPCRQRKVKCAGEQPRCSRCTARNDQCIYNLSPTLSYTHGLEARVKELERSLRQSQASETSPSATKSTEPQSESTFDGLRLDASGAITYQSSTSFFRPATENVVGPLILPWNPKEVENRRNRLVQNAWQQRSLEILAQTPEPFQYMLNNHWCWIQPLFNFIYRPAFTRDMQVLGSYYSHTLLNAILAHSARWCRQEPNIRSLLEAYDEGTLFSRHARALIFEEIRQGNGTVPTVQTLLILSAQECGAGNRTQAWLYSGMAFRLIEDMGYVLISMTQV